MDATSRYAQQLYGKHVPLGSHLDLEWLAMGGEMCSDCSTCIASESYVPAHIMVSLINRRWFCDVVLLPKHIPRKRFRQNSINIGKIPPCRTRSDFTKFTLNGGDQDHLVQPR